MQKSDKKKAQTKAKQDANKPTLKKDNIRDSVHHKQNAKPPNYNYTIVRNEPTINVQHPEQKDGWTIANKISLWMLIFTVLLFFCTYLLYLKAATQTEAAIKAANAAVDAVNETKKANDLSAKNIDFAIQSAKDADDMNKKTLQVQIDVFNDSKKKFEASHQPLLQAFGFKLNLNIGDEPTINFELVNTTDIPIQIIGSKHLLSTKIFEFEQVFKQPTDSSILNAHFIKGVSSVQTTGGGGNGKTNLTANQINLFKSKPIPIYLAREIKYINLITQQVKYYRFFVKLIYADKTPVSGQNLYPIFLKNGNYDK